jgi:hypothetical protein
MDRRFVPALDRIQRLLQLASKQIGRPIRFALIGGLAVAAWGIVRATEDIDFLADSDPSPLADSPLRLALKRLFERHGCHVDWRVGAHDDPIPLLLRIELSRPRHGLGVDILWASKSWQRDALIRTVEVRVSRRRVRVLHPEDLILLKLEAGGPRDLFDIQGLLSAPPPELKFGRLQETARKLGLKTALEKCLRQIPSKQ